ncbi:MAG TPA: fructose 1,6-bisphosphatase [Thermoplasmata archaeon]|nr:fructose 1,6-bisphosphatase [Thermoplasmata archaeon]
MPHAPLRLNFKAEPEALGAEAVALARICATRSRTRPSEIRRPVRRSRVRAARRQVAEPADYMRRHGPFEPHRLPMDEMEYTTMPELMEKHQGKWEDVR